VAVVNVLVVLLVVLVAILVCSNVWSEPLPEPPTAPAPVDMEQEQELVDVATAGLVRAVEAEHWAWYACGAVIPKEEYPARAEQIVRALRTALREVGLSHPNYLWGAMGIMWQESRGNPCPLGPYSRRWAVAKKVVKEKRLERWTVEDSLAALRAAGKAKRGVDAGLGQNIWPVNAQVLEDGVVRPATAEEMVSVEGSARALAWHLAEQAKVDARRPWAYWPGLPSAAYAARVEGWVRVMRGPKLGAGARWR
jgi:hypothetical protein